MNTSTSTHNSALQGIDVPRTLPGVRMMAVAGIATVIVALLISLPFDSGHNHFFHAYLLSVCFFLSISLGALFFVTLQHLTGARWSVVIRRIAELLTTPLFVLGLLMLPILVPMLFGCSAPFEWNDVELRASDELIRNKAPYLNAPMFALRAIIYFSFWILLSRFYLKTSVQQDRSNDAELTVKMRRVSGPAMIAFAVTVNFAAFDWLMSLDPHWFSTIFGVYFFAGAVVAFLATLPITTALAQTRGLLTKEITTEHYHDIGKLLFGFMFLWAYIAFSQYLLIWYANIPEETSWFLLRQNGGWQIIALLLVAGHFALPMFGLMSRSARRDRKTLLFWSTFLLVMHWLDLFWIVMPNVSTELSIGIIEILCTLGVGAIWAAATLRAAAGTRLLPTGDPHLHDSLSFHNH